MHPQRGSPLGLSPVEEHDRTMATRAKNVGLVVS